MFGRNKKAKIDLEPTDFEDELTLEERVDKVIKIAEETREKVDKIIQDLPRIDELKIELAFYKKAFMDRVSNTENMLSKMIDKPVAPPAKSAVESYQDMKTAQALANSGNSKGGFAAVDKKAS